MPRRRRAESVRQSMMSGTTVGAGRGNCDEHRMTVGERGRQMPPGGIPDRAGLLRPACCRMAATCVLLWVQPARLLLDQTWSVDVVEDSDEGACGRFGV